MEPFLAEIPAELLPKIFSEAINITRRLRLKYIWIDSLCIIQDDDNDWQKEAAMMASVYGGSSINIAASSATNVHQSCFLKYPYFSGGLRARIAVNGIQSVRDFRADDEYERSTTESHLATRAWAFQEKVLPPRTIHLGERGAFWECRTIIANEFLPGGFSNHIVKPLISGFMKMMQYTDPWWWADIVKLYSRANLTFPKDKLPALSGVTRFVYNKTGDRYLAGMWKANFEAQMCWQTPTPRKRPPSWRSPTWSWTSLDGELGYHHADIGRRLGFVQDGYAHLLDAKITLQGHDPFGQISAGTIRMGCSSLLAGYFSLPDTIKITYDDASLDVHVRRDSFDDGGCESGDIVYLLPILGGQTGLSSNTKGGKCVWENVLNGVLLRETGVAAGHFYRVGSFNVYQDLMGGFSDMEGKNYYQPVVQLLEKEGQRVAEAVCAEVIENSDHPEERFVIYID